MGYGYGCPEGEKQKITTPLLVTNANKISGRPAIANQQNCCTCGEGKVPNNEGEFDTVDIEIYILICSTSKDDDDEEECEDEKKFKKMKLAGVANGNDKKKMQDIWENVTGAKRRHVLYVEEERSHLTKITAFRKSG